MRANPTRLSLPDTTQAPLANELKTRQPSGIEQFQPGDHIRSIHAGHTGRVVRIYADGSAAVHWDDREPQPVGLAHERMPRTLLGLVPAVSQARREAYRWNSPEGAARMQQHVAAYLAEETRGRATNLRLVK